MRSFAIYSSAIVSMKCLQNMKINCESGGHALINHFKLQGVSGQPILVQPDTPEAAAKHLSFQPRMVEVGSLVAALHSLGDPSNLRLYLCRYGMKVNAESFLERCFFQHLQP